ncbi:MAG: hypothetical protein RI897_3182 [Verrucomicrobiota bacterium]|jgi:hypothetical protein
MESSPAKRSLLGFIAAASLWLTITGSTAPWVIYETGFEPPEFEVGYTLDGQGDWLVPWWATPADEAPTSQIDTGYFEDMGQQALIGWSAPTGMVESVSAYRPLFVDPAGRGLPIVVFSVTMAILDDTEPDPNSFRWVVYNREESNSRLFALDFDMANNRVAYLIDDDPQAIETGYSFIPQSLYELAVTMNLASNLWSASLNGQLIVNAAPMTLSGRTLDLGDIDAAWVLGPDSNDFGDSYMVFDNFKVTADIDTPLPCRVIPLGHWIDGSFLVEIEGEPGRTYALQASSDLEEWFTVAVNTPEDGRFVVLDSEVAGWPWQYYRARAVWP